MNAIVSFRKCSLSDDEMVEKIDQMTDDLFDHKHKHMRERVLSRHIPAQPNNDYDLLIGELCVRFLERSWKDPKVDGLPPIGAVCVIRKNGELMVGKLIDNKEWDDWMVNGENEDCVDAYLVIPDCA